MDEEVRMIVFLGAPTLEHVLKTWNGEPVPQTDDYNTLPPFQVDQFKTNGVAWRRLKDPIDGLSQDIADVAVSPPAYADDFLERSLLIFNDEPDDAMMDVDYSAVDISQFCSPFLTGYDFDINEITELEDIAQTHLIRPSRNYSLAVVIKEISPCQTVETKYGKSVPFAKLVVADQTASDFELACWESMAILSQSMRQHDIVYFRGIPSRHFR
jgi:hypothetical protein